MRRNEVWPVARMSHPFTFLSACDSDCVRSRKGISGVQLLALLPTALSSLEARLIVILGRDIQVELLPPSPVLQKLLDTVLK